MKNKIGNVPVASFPMGEDRLLYREGKKRKSCVLWKPLLSSGQFWFTKFNFNRRKRQFSLGTPRKGRGITFAEVLTCVGARLYMPSWKMKPPWAAQHGYFVLAASVFCGILLTCVCSGLGKRCWQLTLTHPIQALDTIYPHFSCPGPDGPQVKLHGNECSFFDSRTFYCLSAIEPFPFYYF